MRYQLTVTNRIKKRYPEGLIILTGVVCGVAVFASTAIEFYSSLLGMFKNSMIGVHGEKLAPHIYTLIPLVAGGVFFGVIYYEIAEYTSKLKKRILSVYRKKHKVYLR